MSEFVKFVSFIVQFVIDSVADAMELLAQRLSGEAELAEFFARLEVKQELRTHLLRQLLFSLNE